MMIDGKVVVNELADKYEVTEETIRRDLEKLESEGYAKKTDEQVRAEMRARGINV